MRSLLLAVLMTGCSGSAPPAPTTPAPAPAAPSEAASPPVATEPSPAPIETSLAPRAGSGSAMAVQEPADYSGVTTDGGGDRELRTTDPFSQQLADDFRRAWQAPSSSSKVVPVGCIHLTPDGTIVDTKLKQRSGNDAVDDSVQRALDAVKADRNAHPRAVPTHLLALTTKWLCVRFDPSNR